MSGVVQEPFNYFNWTDTRTGGFTATISVPPESFFIVRNIMIVYAGDTGLGIIALFIDDRAIVKGITVDDDNLNQIQLVPFAVVTAPETLSIVGSDGLTSAAWNVSGEVHPNI